jgi:hypothetical protein
MGKSRDIADGTRYVDASGDTFLGDLTGGTPSTAGAAVRFSNNTNSNEKWAMYGWDDQFQISKRDANWGWAGTYLGVDTSGSVLTPNQPAWYAAGSSGWITTSAGGVVPLAAVPLNRGNHYNTSGSKFTAPVAGVYQVNLNAYISSTAQLVLKKNGVDFQPTGADVQFVIFTNNTSHEVCSVSGTISLAAGDYIQLAARSTQSVYVYTGHSSFSGYLVG